jgi:hypothetical protein
MKGKRTMNNNGEMRPSRPCLWAFTLMVLAAVLLLANREVLAQTPAPTPWVQSGNNINNTNTGNVGVGTATPNQKLGVQGMFGLYPQPWVSPNVRGMFMFHTGAGGSIYAFNYPGGTSDPIGFSARSFDFNTYIGGTPHTRFVIDNAGNVGVGTITPAARLHVVGGTRVEGSGRLYFGTSAVENYRGLEIIQESPTIFSLRHHDPNVAWQHIALNPHGGNVGVGTGANNPAYKFDVAGHIRSSSGGFVFPDGTVQTTAASSSGGSASVSPWTTTGSNIHFTSGNVGIGTTAPASRLEVADSGNNTFSARFVQSNVTASNGIFVQTKTASANDTALHVLTNAGATVGMSLRNNGNLGIGTASPATKLDVAGSLHVSGICGGGVPNVQGGYMSWNQKACGGGEVDFINHQGGGAGGFWFANTANGSTLSSLMFISGNGNVGIGTDTPAANAKLDVVGNVNVTGTITGGSIEAKYQDLAEWVPARGALAAGTVVVLDPEQSNRVMASSTSYDTGVAGVVSADPGIILGEAGEGKVKVATTGRVKVKVDATRAIKIGDLLVTSDREGVAMKSEPIILGGRRLHAPGTIVGKALEPLEKGVGEILVLLSMQ